MAPHCGGATPGCGWGIMAAGTMNPGAERGQEEIGMCAREGQREILWGCLDTAIGFCKVLFGYGNKCEDNERLVSAKRKTEF